MFNSFSIQKSTGVRWGGLINPPKAKPPKTEGLRTVLFTSCSCGNQLLKDLARFEELYPGKLNIIGVVTDDPTDPAARISLKKRIWSYYSAGEREVIFRKMLTDTLELGIPCYTGEVKTDYFHEIFQRWNPETLIMYCFGQIIDAQIFRFPPMGSYNLHPSDLPNKIGAGSQPFLNTLQSGNKTSPLVVHEVDEHIDAGPVIGVSPPINICLEDGSYPEQILSVADKILSFGGWMGVELIQTIIRKKERGESGPVSAICFNNLVPDPIRELLQKPAVNVHPYPYDNPRHPLLTE